MLINTNRFSSKDVQANLKKTWATKEVKYKNRSQIYG